MSQLSAENNDPIIVNSDSAASLCAFKTLRRTVKKTKVYLNNTDTNKKCPSDLRGSTYSHVLQKMCYFFHNSTDTVKKTGKNCNILAVIKKDIIEFFNRF